MSEAQEKAVRVLLLSLVQQLSLPEKPTSLQIQTATTAAKTLRNRIIREKERVDSKIQKLKDAFEYGDVRDPNNDDGDDAQLEGQRMQVHVERAGKEDKTKELVRKEYMFIGEMQARGARSMIVDTLCAHGMRHMNSLLPQMLKLLAAMTVPVPRRGMLYGDHHRVSDVLESLRQAASTDDFFAVLVQCVAPIASKRRDGPLPQDDAIMLELILCLFTNLLSGPEAAVVPVVGAMCRSHGVELLLVVLHQNHDRFEQMNNKTIESAHLKEENARAKEDEDEQREDDTSGLAAPSNDDTAPQNATDGSNVAEPSAIAEEAAPADPSNSNRPEDIVHDEEDDEEEEAVVVAAPPSYEDDGVAMQRRQATELIIQQHSVMVAAPIADINATRATVPSLGFFDTMDDGTLNTSPQQVAEVFDDSVFVDATVCVAEEGDPEASDVSDSEDSSSQQAHAQQAAAGESADEDEEDDAAAEEEEDEAEEEEEDEEDEELQIADDAFKHDLVLANLLAEEHEELRGESFGNLLNWNLLILHALSLLFRCGVPSIDISSWSPHTDTANVFSLNEKYATQMYHEKKEDACWRSIARHRPGSATSHGILIRKCLKDTPPNVVIGSVTGLLSGHRANPIDRLKEMDKKKRARYSRKMLVPQNCTSILPVPTLLHLTKQIASFLNSGFEALSVMVWSYTREILAKLKDATAELREAAAQPKFLNEGPMVSDAFAGIQVGDVLHYFGVCGGMLKFTRDSLKQQRELLTNGGMLSPELQKLLDDHWRAMSHIITLDHIQHGFDVLGSLFVSRQLFYEHDICTVMDYLAEMMLLLVALMNGDIVDDAAVTMSAHALGTSVLFHEENIRGVWNWVGHPLIKTQKHVQSATLLLHSLFSLMEKGSYRGVFSVPKRKKAKRGDVLKDDAEDDDEEANAAAVDSDEETYANPKDDAFVDDADDEALQRRLKRRAEKKLQQQEDGRMQPQFDADGIPLPAAAAAVSAADDPFARDDEMSEHEYNEAHRHATLIEMDDDERADAENAAGTGDGDATPLSRRRSRSRDSDVHSASSGHVSLSSEKEASVENFYVRLAQPKNAALLLMAFQHWRTNEVDVNVALCTLFDRLLRHPSARSILFSIHFLMISNDVLQNGKETHFLLYEICDRIAFDFFNPARTYADSEVGLLRKRLDVACRCGRSLFMFNPTNFLQLEELGDDQQPVTLEEAEAPEVDADGYIVPPKRTRRKRQRAEVDPNGNVNVMNAEHAAAEPDDEVRDLDEGFAATKNKKSQQKERRRKPQQKVPVVVVERTKRVRTEDEETDHQARKMARKEAKRERKERRRNKHANNGDALGEEDVTDTTDAENIAAHNDAAPELIEVDGMQCVRGTDGNLYQVYGDEVNGYYYVYQPPADSADADQNAQEGAAGEAESWGEMMGKQQDGTMPMATPPPVLADGDE